MAHVTDVARRRGAPFTFYILDNNFMRTIRINVIYQNKQKLQDYFTGEIVSYKELEIS